MKLCWFLPDDYKGGVFPVVCSVCRQARKAGHDAQILMLCPPSGRDPGADGAFIHSLGLPPNAPEAPERILAWLSRHGVETLVLNGCEEADPVIPFLPQNIRCLYAIHDTARWYWTQAIRFQQELDAIVAVSEAVARNVRPQLVEVTKLRIIANGTSFPAAPAWEAPRPDDLLFVGGDDPMKGVDDAARVWETLQQRGFTGRLHWCGHASAEFVQTLSHLPARDRLVLHGRVSRAEIFELARQAKVVLALTRAESFGMVTLEAMSMGCVPVAWDIETGTKTLVQARVQGLFAPLGDYDAFAAAVLQAVQNHSQLGAAAVVRARTEFTEEAMWSRYEQLITQCVASPKSLRPLAGHPPPRFKARPRLGRILPGWIWKPARNFITSNPRLAYLLRDLRRI
jgi:glycosyltransferase involved in cell wall biosynthesis